MNMQAQDNPDQGAKIVSPAIALHETKPLGLHPTFTMIEPGLGRAVVGFGDGSIKGLSLTLEGALVSSITKLSDTPLAGHADIGGKGVLVGTDAGRLVSVNGDQAQVLSEVDGAWVSGTAVHDDVGVRAFVANRELVVMDQAGDVRFRHDTHPSTLTGLSFSPDGAWVAVSHYGGVSVWATDGSTDAPVSLEWHGSHTAIAWSPCGKFIVTAMQDKEMHCWRWADKKGMRMSGYQAKIRSLSWTADSQYIAASGADTVTSWDCSGDGPSGKPPLEFGYVYNGMVRHVAAHPTDAMVAGGYSDGTVMIGNVAQETAMIARPGGGKPIAGLAWSPDGQILVSADEDGAFAVMRMRQGMA
tara:strand:- start:1783 stop:2853 length:1071 start_codon:yes stop_codon:yes gene_type:complete